MEDEPYFYHPLENIEDIDEFQLAVDRGHLTKALSVERPYTYWTMEMYDQANGIRGGGGLGVLAADMRRIAEQLEVPFVLITPFYPSESHQMMEDGKFVDRHAPKNYRDYNYRKIDTVNIRACGNLSALDVVEKILGTTRIIGITEPNFGELYSGMSGSDHRLYQEVALGFGGYAALKLIGLKPAIIQLNEAATFFAALTRLDELASNGMDFYEAVVYTRKHTLYTNHTLVQAAEAEFSEEQFERFVYPNLKSLAVKKWIHDKFENGRVKLSSVCIEIAELKNGVSRLHARVANYHDLAGSRVKFRAITNGIDMEKWVMPEILRFYHEHKILDEHNSPTPDFADKLADLSADEITALKRTGRRVMNDILCTRTDQNGEVLKFDDEDFVFVFKRRFVDYKRPDMPFRDVRRLRAILEPRNAHYILTGRVHTGDEAMSNKLREILEKVSHDDYLKTHVHYIADYDEKLAFALSVGCNAAINVPVVGLEACGTSWEKDVANLNLLISTHDGGVADLSSENYLAVEGENESQETESLYLRMEEALQISENEFDLEFTIRQQLTAYLSIISGTRMFNEYLAFLFKP